MRFSEYMNEWLYGEGGYYRSFKDIGKEGDFYTAVSTSAFFGASIANYLYKLIKDNYLSKNVALVEIGAHQGYLLGDMIRWLYTQDESLLNSMRFIIIERQDLVIKAQKEYFAKNFGDAVNIEYYKSLKDLNLDEAFFISNEIFDAFACELYKDEKIAIVNNHKISWQDASDDILNFAKKHRLKTGEIAVGYEEFAKEVVNCAKKFDFLSFDYGERYVRNDFSIRVYKKHQTFPLFDKEVVLEKFFKNSDITYDVNFNHVIDSFENAGAKLKIYETQARALVRFGIIDILEQYHKIATTAQYLNQADKVKTLLAPTVMGDRFKLVHFRNYE
jgi:SAM-dependent MidA family methyltransferase